MPKVNQISIGLILLVSTFLVGCFNAESLPETPSISFGSLEYKPVANASDSLILTFNFQDGNGDLGLAANEVSPPYHPFDVVLDSDNQVVTLKSASNPPHFLRSPNGNTTFYTQIDTRRPYNCVDYEIFPIRQNGPVDTVFIKRNENNKNIFVDFYVKRNGVYQFIDWLNINSTNSCGIAFDARFPIFDARGAGKAMQGSIRYGMTSFAFPFVLRSDTFHLRFKIKDRALNESNTVVTPDFTLNEILAN